MFDTAVVMGRHAARRRLALGKKFPEDGPHLIYLPERTFVLERFLADVKAMHERHGRCVIAVSRASATPRGQPIPAQLAE
ncbi:MAG: hypothetical protein U1F67_16270 [Rubrivivax sp.]